MIHNLADHLDEIAKLHPDLDAVVMAGKKNSSAHLKVTYRELSNLTCCYAAGLKADGVQQGQRVLLMVSPGLELIATTWALYRLGAVPILIDPGMGIQNLIRCIRRTKPEVIIGIPRAQWLSLTFRSSFSHLKIRVTVGGTLPFGGSNTRTYRKKALPWAGNAKVSPNDLAAILFTSGSTGSPKGVCYELRHFEAQVDMLKQHFGMKVGLRDLPLLPIFSLFNPAFGVTSIIARVPANKPAKLDPQHIIDLLNEHNIEHSFGAPVLWQKIIRYAQKNSLPLPSLKQVVMAGADVPPPLVELMKKWAPYAKILTPYGATEALPLTSVDGETLLRTRELSESGQGNCVGKPLAGIEIKIIPPLTESISNLANIAEYVNHEIGEIIATGPVVTETYDQLPEETDMAKIIDGPKVWHRTGDVGFIDQQGLLWYCGRLAHVVGTSRGPLYSVCVESVFNQHPDVYRSALIALGGKYPYVPAVVVELEKGRKVNPTKLCMELQKLGIKHLHTASIRNFYIHPSFPVDVRHNAKIHRLELGRWAAKQLPISFV
jgi:olefin beta-lactone synthetase